MFVLTFRSLLFTGTILLRESYILPSSSCGSG